MSKYATFPLVSRKKRALKVKQVTKQPKNNTEADRRPTKASKLAFSLGYPHLPINYDLHLLR